MANLEAKQQTKLKHYIENIGGRYPFEVKATLKDKIRFDEVASHQINSLYTAKHGTFYYKIPDTAIRNKLPFDGFVFTKTEAWIYISFPKLFTKIDIDAYLQAWENDGNYLTVERAKEIADKIVYY